MHVAMQPIFLVVDLGSILGKSGILSSFQVIKCILKCTLYISSNKVNVCSNNYSLFRNSDYWLYGSTSCVKSLGMSVCSPAPRLILPQEKQDP